MRINGNRKTFLVTKDGKTGWLPPSAFSSATEKLILQEFEANYSKHKPKKPIPISDNEDTSSSDSNVDTDDDDVPSSGERNHGIYSIYLYLKVYR